LITYNIVVYYKRPT